MNRADVHQHRREQIIGAAEKLLARKGWSATTFADICKEAGISNGVLTYHFKDKDEILLAVLENASRSYNAYFFSQLQEQPAWHEKLDLIVQKSLSITEEEREMNRLNLHLLSLAAQRPELAPRLRRMYSEAMSKGQSEIEQAVQQGLITRKNPAAVAAVIQMLLIGMSLSSMMLDIPVPNEELTHEVESLLYGYLGIQEPAPEEE